MNNPKRLQELCVIPAAFTVLLKGGSAISEVLRSFVNGGRVITRDNFALPFVETLRQLEKKHTPSFSEQVSGTIFEEPLADLAWWFITSEDSLFGILIAKILPTWNSLVKSDKKIKISRI